MRLGESPDTSEILPAGDIEVEPSNETGAEEVFETRREKFFAVFKNFAERKVAEAAIAAAMSVDDAKKRWEKLENVSTADRMRYAVATGACLASYYYAAQQMPTETAQATIIQYGIMAPELMEKIKNIPASARSYLEASREFLSDKKELVIRGANAAAAALYEKLPISNLNG